jgi:hypothetical protein
MITSAIEHLTVEIKGVQYQIRFGLGALYRLEKYGLSAANIGTEMKEGKNLTTIFAVLASTLGNSGAGGKWIPLGISPEQLADMVPMDQLAELSAAISTAASKVSLASSNGAGMPEAETPAQ